MAFPFTVKGTFPVRDATSEQQLLDEVGRALVEAGAEDVVVQSGAVHFRVPWTLTYGPLWSIDAGTVRVMDAAGQRQFLYELSRRRSALTVALVSYGWLGGMSMLAFHQGLAVALGLGTLAFLFLFTMGTTLFSSFEHVLPFHGPVSRAV